MAAENTEPTTLQEAIVYFKNPDNCLAYLSVRRWPTGVVTCPTCGSTEVRFLATRRLWECKTKHFRQQFSIKVGTIMEDSPLGLDKWLPAMWLIGNDRNGISSWELHRALGVTQKTAWFMLHRIRLSMQDQVNGGKLGGEVEVDETFIGGKARNMHKDKRARRITGTGGKDKTMVMGILERGGKVRAKVVANRKKHALQGEVRKHVEAGSNVYSDALKSYEGMDEFCHQVVDHAVEYVRGNIHTNGLENFWSLLKRGLNGTYISVEPFHLFRYVDEQAFRFNNRKDDEGELLKDANRFDRLVMQIVGKRIMYSQLIGKEAVLSPEKAF